MNYRAFLLLITLSVIAFAMSCEYPRDKSEVFVNQAVADFHIKYNAEQFEAIYDEAHELLHESLTRDEFVLSLRKNKEKFGNALSTKSLTKHTSLLPIGDTARSEVNTILASKFERGEVIEQFYWKIGGYRAYLARYNMGTLVTIKRN